MGEALVSCPWGQSSLVMRKTLGREDCLHHEVTAPGQASLGPLTGAQKARGTHLERRGLRGCSHTQRFNSSRKASRAGDNDTRAGTLCSSKVGSTFTRQFQTCVPVRSNPRHNRLPMRHVQQDIEMRTFPQTVYYFKYPHVRRPLSVGKYEHVYPFNLLFRTHSKTCKSI